MSIAEVLLIIGTFGICTGVWTTLFVILKQNSKDNQTTWVNVKPNKV